MVHVLGVLSGVTLKRSKMCLNPGWPWTGAVQGFTMATVGTSKASIIRNGPEAQRQQQGKLRNGGSG